MIRTATPDDLPALGRLGALLMRTHYAFDPHRFLPPGDNPEAGYASFLETELREPDVAILVAERDGQVVGYVYAGLEPLSWKELRGPAGFIHDIVVADDARGTGVARELTAAAVEWLRRRRASSTSCRSSPSR
jgi:GNAT superfamily N-acetyltransferase